MTLSRPQQEHKGLLPLLRDQITLLMAERKIKLT